MSVREKPAISIPDIVDAHHHLWDLERVHYPWLMARGVKRFFGDPTPIQRNYLIADFRADIGDLPVKRSIHVQVGAKDELAETRWLQSVADAENSSGMPQGIVAFCDLAADDAGRRLDALQAFPNVRGIRQIVGRSPEEDAATGSGALLDDRRWRENLAELARRGLTFDLQLIPPQMTAAADAFAQVPGLRVALCHCGSPWDRSEAGIAAWRAGLQALAQLPNTCCKLSGFGMFDRDWDAASVRDIAMTVIDTFGPERCMFGSNFPVDKLYRDYRSVYAQYFELTAGFSRTEREALLAATATEFYRLED